MNNIVYARCYTSDHLEQLLLEAASLMVNDEDRNLVNLIQADEIQCCVFALIVFQRGRNFRSEGFALLIVDSIMGGFRVDYSGRGAQCACMTLHGSADTT